MQRSHKGGFQQIIKEYMETGQEPVLGEISPEEDVKPVLRPQADLEGDPPDLLQGLAADCSANAG